MIEEFINVVEYIMVKGNGNIILCEWGICMYERVTCNMFDIFVVLILKKEIYLFVVVDVMYFIGWRDFFLLIVKVVMVIGVDVIMVEVYFDLVVVLFDVV